LPPWHIGPCLPQFVWQSRRGFTYQFGHPLGMAAIPEEFLHVSPASTLGQLGRFQSEPAHLPQRFQGITL